ncbi:APC family permease, partial [Singulisphaera rosea]
AARFPEAGGIYVYLREAFGPRPAFLLGWMSLLVTDPGITAALATGMAAAFKDAFGLSPLGLKAIAVGVILVLATINAVGLGVVARLLRGLVLLKLGILAFLAIWGFGLGRGDWSNVFPLTLRRSGAEPLPGALIGAMISAFFSFGGWWDLSKLTGEVREPARTIPKALTCGVLTVTGIYILVSFVFIYLVPLSRIGRKDTFATLVGEAFFGPSGTVLFAGIVAIVVFGSVAAILMAAPRVYYAMAQDGLFPRSLAAIHPKFGTPARAIAIQAILASALVISGTFEQILAYFFFVTVAFLVLTVLGVYPLARRDGNDLTLRSRIPGYPITPLLFLFPIALLLVLLAAGRPVQTLLGSVVVLLGLPVYQFAFRRRA